MKDVKRFVACAAVLAMRSAWASPALAQEPAPPQPALELAPAPAETAPVTAPPPFAQAAPLELGPERPEPMTLGFGFGTTIAGDLLKPNTASVRFVVSEELQLEPLVVLSLAGGPGDTVLNLQAGTLVRYVLDSRGPVDLQLLAGPSLTHASGAGSTTGLTVTWGASAVWYFASDFAASMDALNPLLTLQDAEDTTWTFGAIWNPSLTLMLHMYL